VATSSVCAAVINVARVDDDRLIFTAVPIVYGDYTLPSGHTIHLDPPSRLNLYGKLPITNPPPEPPPVPPAKP
jgi:hypothetical protein